MKSTDDNEEKRREIENLILKWLENKITTARVCTKLDIGFDEFKLLLNRYRHVLEDYSFKKADEFANSMLKLIAEEKYDEEIIKECKEIIDKYKNKKTLLSDALSKASKLGIKKEHILAMISVENNKSTDDLFEILEYEGNLCSDLLSRDQIFNELQKLREGGIITLWDTNIQPKPRGDMFIRLSTTEVISHIEDLLGDDVQIKDTLEDNMKIIIVPSEDPKDFLPRIFYLEEHEDGVIFYSFLSEDRKEKALKRITEPLIQTGLITEFWINPEYFFKFGKKISAINSFLKLKSISQKFDNRIAHDFSCDMDGDDIEFIYSILREHHGLPESISVFSRASPFVLFEFTNQGTFSLGRGDFKTMVSRMKEFFSIKSNDREKFRVSTILYRFSEHIVDLDFDFIKSIIKEAFIDDSIRKENRLFPNIIPAKTIHTHFSGVAVHENDERLMGYLFDNIYGYNCKFALDIKGITLLPTTYTNPLIFEKIYEKIVEHLDEGIDIISNPEVREYEFFAQNTLNPLLNYPSISNQEMINALIDIGTQFASLCYEENRQELHKTKVEWTSEQFSAKISQFSGGQEIRSLVRAEMIKLLENQGLFYSRGRKLILNLVPGNRAQIKSYFDKLSNFCKDINMTDEKQKNLDDL
jgi:hypothetical protein